MKITKITITQTITNHASAQAHIVAMPDPNSMSIEEVIDRIIILNDGLQRFWGNATGWASLEAAQLLTESRLDWQVSLSHCLKLWTSSSSTEDAAGRLILAWANLGSLVEGSLKLFLSVWYESYKTDVEAIKRNGKLREPDRLELELLRQFFKKCIWDDSLDGVVQRIQQRRNAIHAFADRDIGTHEELLADIRVYLQLLRYINFRLPYPDEIYIPQETHPDTPNEFLYQSYF